MAKTGVRSRAALASCWLVVGVAMIAVPLWLGWTRWQAVLTGHPLMLALTIGCLLLGFVAVAWATATLVLGDRADDPGSDRQLTAAQRTRRADRRIALGVPPLLLCVLLVTVLAWARPLSASPAGVAAMRSGNDVQVSDRITWYEMVSVAPDENGDVRVPAVGLVFLPGARVDTRAYGPLLAPLARAGYLVTVLKEPFGVALVDTGHARTVMELHPEIKTWAVGGHSLGGVAAASFADEIATVGDAAVAGLVLYASYPSSRLERADLQAVSISGDQDGLTTPQDVAQSKKDLPADTRYVVVPGAVHSFFGDYGEQQGDGTPTVDRAVAQAQITKATAELLVAVTPKAKPKKK